MATNKPTDEKITEIDGKIANLKKQNDEKIAQLKNQKRRLQNKVNSEEKKARDRRHFKIGEIIEDRCGEITDIEAFELFLAEHSSEIKETQMNEKEQIVTLTGRAFQDDETFKYEGGFVPERDQFYFELQQGDKTFLIGFKDMMICLKLLEQLEEIPKLPQKWWNQTQSLYGCEADMLESNILEKEG